MHKISARRRLNGKTGRRVEEILIEALDIGLRQLEGAGPVVQRAATMDDIYCLFPEDYEAVEEAVYAASTGDTSDKTVTHLHTDGDRILFELYRLCHNGEKPKPPPLRSPYDE